MKHYGLLGEHLSHSYSKMIHQYLFKEFNLDADYSLIECQEQDLKYWIKKIRTKEFSGFNVTIPYKKKIMSYLDVIDEKAIKIGSVNTVYLLDGKVHGTNTDYDGFLETLNHYQIDAKNKNCYILGTGGASLAVLQVLQDLGGICSTVSRTPNTNQIGYFELKNKDIDLLVNTTPVGMYPNVNESPVPKEIALQAKTVIDIIFNPERTQLLKDANSGMNGLYMLVLQAIRAEEIWQKRKLEIQISFLLSTFRFLLDLPKEIFLYVKDLTFTKDQIGQSEDYVYQFEQKYILKISKDKSALKREKECVDWLSEKILGSKSVAWVEGDTSYYLRTVIEGEPLSSKRFLDQPLLLIRILKQAILTLRKLDQYSCPFQSKDSVGASFVHGDLCLPNILVNKDNEFCGFIDLGNAGLGDPYYDYAWLLWSFEYNLKTDQFNSMLLETLGVKMTEEIYQKYIPISYLEQLKRN